MTVGIKLGGLNMGIDTDRENWSMPGMPWKMWFQKQMERVRVFFFQTAVFMIFVPLMIGSYAIILFWFVTGKNSR